MSAFPSHALRDAVVFAAAPALNLMPACGYKDIPATSRPLSCFHRFVFLIQAVSAECANSGRFGVSVVLF